MVQVPVQYYMHKFGTVNEFIGGSGSNNFVPEKSIKWTHTTCRPDGPILSVHTHSLNGHSRHAATQLTVKLQIAATER